MTATVTPLSITVGDQNGLGESKGLAQQLGPANIPILHSKFLQLGAARIAQVDQAIAKDVTTLVQQMGTSLQLLNHDAHDLRSMTMAYTCWPLRCIIPPGQIACKAVALTTLLFF